MWFALLDNITPSLFCAVCPETQILRWQHRTQHIAAHIGTLQRGGTKLDREGRDYWIKPLRDTVMEAVYLQPLGTSRSMIGPPLMDTLIEGDWKLRLTDTVGQGSTRAVPDARLNCSFHGVTVLILEWVGDAIA